MPATAPISTVARNASNQVPVVRNGMVEINQNRFFDRYAGCLVKAYGPWVRMPRWVRLEKRKPKLTVAQA